MVSINLDENKSIDIHFYDEKYTQKEVKIEFLDQSSNEIEKWYNSIIKLRHENYKYRKN